MTASQYKRLRKKLGTQEQAAEILGVTARTIIRRERGAVEIGPEAAVALQRAVACPRKAIRKRNPKRRASEFARAYGSEARVQAIKALACYGCGLEPAENCHLPSRSGMGRKGDWKHVVDLGPACHRELHSIGVDGFDREHETDLRSRAAWLAEFMHPDKFGVEP